MEENENSKGRKVKTISARRASNFNSNLIEIENWKHEKKESENDISGTSEQVPMRRSGSRFGEN